MVLGEEEEEEEEEEEADLREKMLEGLDSPNERSCTPQESKILSRRMFNMHQVPGGKKNNDNNSNNM